MCAKFVSLTAIILGRETLMAEETPGTPPKAFISYSWDDGDHKRWTKELAARLRADGVDATIDQWAAVPGDRLPHFMEQAIRENSYVLIVCTPKYKEKSDSRTGGVGYEGDIMTGEVHTQGNHRKFIPVLRRGDRTTAMPSWVAGKYDIDLRDDPYSEGNYLDLLRTLHKVREEPPPIGPSPFPKQHRQELKNAMPPPESKSCEFEPIKIMSVLVDEVTEPRNDGTRGSALYTVPFKLSRSPSNEWADQFVQTWRNPPRFTLSHRPGIASIRGDRLILEGTTIEEIQKAHHSTLKLVVDKVNEEIAELAKKRRAAEQAKDNQSQEHRENVRRLANDLKFD